MAIRTAPIKRVEFFSICQKNNITKKNTNILYECFYGEKKAIEISEKYEVTRQFVSKILLNFERKYLTEKAISDHRKWFSINSPDFQISNIELASIRTFLGFSKAQAAKLISCTREREWSYYERGTKQIPEDVVLKIIQLKKTYEILKKELENTIIKSIENGNNTVYLSPPNDNNDSMIDYILKITILGSLKLQHEGMFTIKKSSQDV